MKDLLKQFNLPNYLKGKSFSEDSKIITDKTRGKNKEFSTPEDIAYEKELLSRLKSAQEFVKSQNEPQPQQVDYNQEQMALGGPLEIIDGINSVSQLANSAQPIQGNAKGLASAGGVQTSDIPTGTTPIGIDSAAGAAEGMSSAASMGAGMAGQVGGDIINKFTTNSDGSQSSGAAGLAGAIEGGSKYAALGPAAMAGGAIVHGSIAALKQGKENKLINKQHETDTYGALNKANKDIQLAYSGAKDLVNKYALGGGPCGGEGQPPCPENKLGMKDIVNINQDQNAPLQFTQDEFGMDAMNTLFQPAPPPIEKAVLNQGMYEGHDYFTQDPSDPTGLTISQGAGMNMNRDDYEKRFKKLQGFNPNLKLKMNAYGGKIDDMKKLNQFSQLAEGGPVKPPKKKGRERLTLGQGLEELITGEYGNWDMNNPDSQKDNDVQYNPEFTGGSRYFADKHQALIDAITKRNTKPKESPAKAKAAEESKVVNEDSNILDKLNLRYSRGVNPKTKGISTGIDPIKDFRKHAAGIVRKEKGIDQGGVTIDDSDMRLQWEKDAEKIQAPEGLANQLRMQELKDMLGEKDLTTLVRSAPAAMNAYQLAKLEKPGAEGYDRLNARYKKNLMDEQAIQNKVREGTSNVREAIVGSSGGSGSAARANLLASQMQGTKALSDAYAQAAQVNAAESGKEQQFNLGVDRVNLEQANREQVARAQNKGAYDTQKSKLRAAMATDIGNMGKEALYKKYPELMGLDYNSLGKYLEQGDGLSTIIPNSASKKDDFKELSSEEIMNLSPKDFAAYSKKFKNRKKK